MSESCWRRIRLVSRHVSTTPRASAVALMVGLGCAVPVVGTAGASVLGPATIDICKAATVSGNFAFSLNSGTPITVAAGSCDPITVENGYNTVTELADPTGATTLNAINVTPSVDTVRSSVATRSVTVNIPANAEAEVSFVNVPVVPNPEIEVCKVAGDPSLVGKSFSFTEQAPGISTVPFPIPAGAPGAAPSCGGLTPLPAGTSVNVAEVPTSGNTVSSITVAGGTASNVNTTAGTVTATLGATGTTIVTYTDIPTQQPGGSIKVCKVLAPGSGVLAGSVFTFEVTDGTYAQTVDVTAVAPGATPPCVAAGATLPIGSVATVTEQAQPNVALMGVAVTPPPQDAGSTATTAKVLVESTVASATFTNEALGWVEVCKNAADASVAGHTFTFTVNGGAPFPVTAGQCSQPMQVPTGTASVDELETNPSFYLAGVSTKGVTDPNGSRLLTGPRKDPALVTVVPGAVSTETEVTFTNASKQGGFKICSGQTSPGAALQGTDFPYAYSYTVNGVTTTGSVALTTPLVGSTCSGIFGPIAVTNSDGSPVVVSVTASMPAVVSVDLAGFRYQGGGSVTSGPTLPAALPDTFTFTLGAGMNVASFIDGAVH